MEPGGQHAASPVAAGAPFCCRLCGKNFSNATSLEIHEQYSHAPSAPPPPPVGAVSGAAAPAPAAALREPPPHQPFHGAAATQEEIGADWSRPRQVEPASAAAGGQQPEPPPGAGRRAVRAEEQFYHNVNYWPQQPGEAPPVTGVGHDTAPPPAAADGAGTGWSGEHHFPPTPDSGGFGGPASSKSPAEGGADSGPGAEILDLDSNRVHFYTAPVPPPWAMQQPFFYGGGPPPVLPGHPAHMGHAPHSHFPPPDTSPFNATPPPPMIPPKTQLDPPYNQHPHGQHQQFMQNHHPQPPPPQGYPGMQVPMPPPVMYSGFHAGSGPPPPSGAESPGCDKMRTDALAANAQHCKRPKTYLCEVCDKKFTSMGHLKRHYNTIVHKQTKEGKRGPGMSPSSAKAKQRTAPRTTNFEEGSPPAVPPLVSMQSNMYGMQYPPASGPPPPQYPMTPPLQEQSPLPQPPPPHSAAFEFAPARQQQPHATAILAPPPQPLGYGHQMAPEYQVSVAAAPNPQQPPPEQQSPHLQQQQHTTFPAAFSAAGIQLSHGYGGYPAECAPVYSQAGAAPALYGQPAPAGTAPQPQPQLQPTPDSGVFPAAQQRARETSAPSPASTASAGSSEDSLPGTPTEEPYMCCNRRFTSLTYWKQHRESQHAGDRPVRCGQCCRKHRLHVSCEQHERTHPRTHQCDTCEKEFMHSSDLKRHKYTHVAQKPFICPHCSKGFIRKDQMEKHLPTHETQPQQQQQPPSPDPALTNRSPQQQQPLHHPWSPNIHHSSPAVHQSSPGLGHDPQSSPGLRHGSPGFHQSSPGLRSSPGFHQSSPTLRSSPGFHQSSPGLRSSPGFHHSFSGGINGNASEQQQLVSPSF